MNDEINVIESFNTWQGEGPDSGKYMLLLRFKTCNRNCLFCDTKQKLQDLYEMNISHKDIQNNININNCGIMITGGEPTYDNNFNQTLNLINNIKCKLFNIETNGFKLLELIRSIDIDNSDLSEYKQKNIKYIFSPKFESENDLDENFIKTRKIIDYNYNNVYFKIVYQNKNLIRYYLDFLKETYDKLFGKVYLMPEGKTIQELMKNSYECFNVAKQYGFNISSRAHIIYNFI